MATRRYSSRASKYAKRSTELLGTFGAAGSAFTFKRATDRRSIFIHAAKESSRANSERGAMAVFHRHVAAIADEMSEFRSLLAEPRVIITGDCHVFVEVSEAASAAVQTLGNWAHRVGR